MNKFTIAFVSIMSLIAIILVFNSNSDIKKHGADKIEKIYQTKDKYYAESAPQATQLNTQLETQMTREIGKQIGIALHVIITLLMIIIIILSSIAIQLSVNKKSKPTE